MFSIFMVILYVLVVKEAKASEKKIKNSIVYLTKKYKTKKLSQKRLNILAKWILLYSKKWNIDPLVVVCIAHHESRFKDYPRRVKVRRCRTKVIDGKKVKKLSFSHLGTHATISDLKLKLPDIFDNYVKIAFVRNSWGRMASFFNYYALEHRDRFQIYNWDRNENIQKDYKSFILELYDTQPWQFNQLFWLECDGKIPTSLSARPLTRFPISPTNQ